MIHHCWSTVVTVCAILHELIDFCSIYAICGTSTNSICFITVNTAVKAAVHYPYFIRRIYVGYKAGCVTTALYGSRYPAVTDVVVIFFKIIGLSHHAANSTSAADDFSRQPKVFYDVALGISEQADVAFIRVDIHVDGVTITIKRATIIISTTSNGLCDGDVSHKHGIHIIAAFSLSHQVAEDVPVCRTLDENFA